MFVRMQLDLYWSLRLSSPARLPPHGILPPVITVTSLPRYAECGFSVLSMNAQDGDETPMSSSFYGHAAKWLKASSLGIPTLLGPDVVAAEDMSAPGHMNIFSPSS